MRESKIQSQFVVNFHINEVCNFGCKYCYSDWGLKTNRNDVFRDASKRRQILTELWSFLAPSAWNIPSPRKQAWDGIRLSFAGGEPLLYTQEVLAGTAEAKSLGFDLSIITNGCYFSADLATKLAPDLEWLGISVDSIDHETNARIGRADGQGRQVNIRSLSEAIRLAREVNPELKIKINTVVNELNHGHDLSSFIGLIKPDKWKVLRALPSISDALSVSEERFNKFIERHHDFRSIMRRENNGEMIASYLMVDPLGRFFDNSSSLNSKHYRYSDPIHVVGAQQAFSQIEFNVDAFNARYTSNDNLEDQV